ncbi:MAG: S8 family serine peptidase [Desulfosarcinaceae bacterium]|nr:S8 family serine peptidase [Desulfosarcinaceae bacterium]
MSKKKALDILKIAVTFKRPIDKLGLTQYGAPMSADVVSSFVPESENVGKAMDELAKRGFTITTRGRLTASIRGSKKDFEKLFRTKLSKIAFKSDAAARFSADSVLYPDKDAPWKPIVKVAKLIDDAYIQWPHIYFNQRFAVPPPSPLPPQVDYHSLRVPGDVSLLMNASKVHRAGYTGRGIRVAMIDSGFAHGHPYFQEMGYNSSVVLAPGATHQDQDGNGHGTGESANIFAIAPDVTFIGVKLDNEEDPYSSASILEGFQEALSHEPDIISVSLGYDLCPQNPFTGGRISHEHLTSLPNGLKPLEAEISQAVADGIVVVFAAGNGHVAFPGMMPEVISAGGVYVDSDGSMQASSYASAFSSKPYPGRNVPDFCGLVGLADNNADYIMLPIPSECEIDTGNSGHDGTQADDGWGVFSGTSAAAPQVAAVCALLLEKDPNLTPGEIKSVLRRTSRDVVNGAANPFSNVNQAMPAGPGIDGATGAGLVDAFAAFNQV